MDITYISMERGFVYLVAVMDRASRGGLSWRLSLTLDSSFCTAALDEAIATFGCPTIMNTDQGAQFTSAAFTSALLDRGIRISMMEVAADATTSSSNGSSGRTSTKRSIFTATNACPPRWRASGGTSPSYNSRRPHSSLADRTPTLFLLLGTTARGCLTPAFPLIHPSLAVREAEPLHHHTN